MTKPATGAHRLPRVLPRARGILLTFSSRPSAVSVAVVPRSGGEPRILVEDAADARFVAPDHILFVRNGLLMAAPFDVERLALQGPPVALIAGVQQAWGSGRPPANTGAAFFDVSASGTLVYASGGIYPQELTRLVWVDREGRTRPLETPNGSYARPRLSPDGRSIVVVYRETPAGSGVEKRGLATYDLVRGAFNRLTDKDEWSPVWSADGAQIFFFVPGGYGLGRIPADGSAPAEKILGGKTRRVPSSASPDGSLLAVIEDGEGTGSDIALLPLKGERQLRPWLNTPANEAWAEFSPDGRFLAYASDATGRREVYVQPFPGPGARQQVSIDGGDSPLWAHGGRELFFTSHGEKGTTLMAAEVNAGPPLSFGRPHPLFAGPYNTLGGPTGYDVAPDGKSFLMVEALENPKFPTTSLHIVLNWTEELRRMAAGVNR